jgi:hypothetical protein
MRRPSGLTSTFSHVPSSVSNDSFEVGPRSATTSHFLSSFCACVGANSALMPIASAKAARDGREACLLIAALISARGAVDRACESRLGCSGRSIRARCPNYARDTSTPPIDTAATPRRFDECDPAWASCAADMPCGSH